MTTTTPPRHTPGPWSVREGQLVGNGRCLALVLGADDFPDLPADRLDEPTAEAHANARLIALAPQVLADAREFLRHACRPGDDGVYDDRFDAARDRLRATILKIDGVKGGAA